MPAGDATAVLVDRDSRAAIWTVKAISRKLCLYLRGEGVPLGGHPFDEFIVF
jgi:hypothetical protein